MTVHATKYRPSHPRASASGCVYAHVVVAEAALGRLLPDGCEVHHVDENPRNNAPNNLVICQDAAYHKLLHARARIVRAGGNPDSDRVCSTCRGVKATADFNRSARGFQTQCRECSHAYTRTYVRKAIQ